MSDRASSPAPAPAPTAQQTIETVDTEAQVKEESPNLPSPTTSVAQNSEAPSSSPGRSIERTRRRAYLQEDPLAGEVEPHRVFCRRCQKWIRLTLNTQYSLQNWYSHKLRCPPSSSRVAAAERKIVLLNDPQVKTFSTARVQCGNCRTVVELEGDVDYDLTKWGEHKETCKVMTRAPITPRRSQSRVFPPPSTSSTHSQVSVGRPARSPTPVEGSSSHATETTVVAESPPVAVKAGEKRGREEETEEEEEVEDARPVNRPRTETYTPPDKDVPRVFGWLMQPLKEFARGFREGLGST